MYKSLKTWTLHVQYNNKAGLRRHKYQKRYKGPLKDCALWHNPDNSLIEFEDGTLHVLVSFKLPNKKIKQVDLNNISVECSEPTKKLIYLLNKHNYVSKENNVIYATTLTNRRIKLIDLATVCKIHYICSLNTVFISSMEKILDYPNGIHGTPVVIDDDDFSEDDYFYVFKEQLRIDSITNSLQRAFPCNSELLAIIPKFNSLPKELHNLYTLSSALDSLYDSISCNSRSIIWNPKKRKPIRDLVYTKYINQLLHVAKLYQIINELNSSLTTINSILPELLKYMSSPRVVFCDSKVLQNMACVRYKDISIAMSRLQNIITALRVPITEAYQEIRVADFKKNPTWRRYMLTVLKQDKLGEVNKDGAN